MALRGREWKVFVKRSEWENGDGGEDLTGSGKGLGLEVVEGVEDEACGGFGLNEDGG